MLKIFGTFHEQWGKFKEQMEKVKARFEGVGKEYEELLGARTRQLDRPLEKIEELRVAQDDAAPALDAAIEKAKSRVLAPNSETKLVR